MEKSPLYMITQLNHINIILSKKRENSSLMTDISTVVTFGERQAVIEWGGDDWGHEAL